ncbi:MAG: hypothetical protein KGN01_06685 [Patescibacteria group bacterium]|nr:hypothetical protein [Patescibacteria group bacterium]
MESAGKFPLKPKILRTIWIKTAFVGFHHWKEAPEEVAYQRATHRHLFKVHVEVETGSSSKKLVEVHSLKVDVDKFLSTLQSQFTLTLSPNWSLVKMSEALSAHLMSLGYQVMQVSFSEDNECGSAVMFMYE